MVVSGGGGFKFFFYDYESSAHFKEGVQLSIPKIFYVGSIFSRRWVGPIAYYYGNLYHL